MALLGSSVDPRLFMQDYSGFTRAAEIQAQGMQNLGAAIGQGIKDFGEAREERKKLDAQVKADDVSIESAMKLGESLGIDIKSYLEPIQALRKDPNTTPAQSLALGRAAAQGISNAFTLGIGAQERKSAQQRAMVEQQYKMADLAIKGERADIARMQAEKGPTPKFELRKPQITSPTGEVFEGPELPYDVNRGMYFDTKANKYIADPNLIGTGKEYAPDSAMPTPTSQVGGGAADLIASAAQMNIGKLSTAKTPGTQGGNVGCADAICRTFKQATGEELVPGGTLSTREMATTLESDPRFIKVPLTEAQKGDIVLTPRKGNKAGHTGIVIDGGAIASNSSKGFAGKTPGTFVQNYTIDSWRKNVAPRNPSETAAYRYVKAQGIDNALAMGGDMTQQAMGTPEQQAMLSQQIEQGAGMATAQNVPQGAMPTEPSMATQQPQLPQQAAPQWSPPRGFAPVGTKGKKIEIITGPTAQALNLDPRGTYEVSREDGNITGVQTITSAPTIGETAKAEASKSDLEKAKRSKEIAIKTISDYVDDKGVPTERLDKAVGYGEAFATGVAEYAPFIGTQSGETRSDQQRLSRLVETDVLEAASLLKPVSNTDLLMLIKNRPTIVQPTEVWTKYFSDIKEIISDPDNYIDAAKPEEQKTATQKLRGKLQGQ